MSESLRDAERLSNEELAACLDAEVNFLVQNRPHETAHIAVFVETARRLRNG